MNRWSRTMTLSHLLIHSFPAPLPLRTVRGATRSEQLLKIFPGKRQILFGDIFKFNNLSTSHECLRMNYEQIFVTSSVADLLDELCFLFVELSWTESSLPCFYFLPLSFAFFLCPSSLKIASFFYHFSSAIY